MKKNTNNTQNCCNHNCFKNHCARHWKNHDDDNAINLNPYDEFKCKFYSPRHVKSRKNQCVQIEGFEDKNTKKLKR